jgi:hypothetical protein
VGHVYECVCVYVRDIVSKIAYNSINIYHYVTLSCRRATSPRGCHLRPLRRRATTGKERTAHGARPIRVLASRGVLLQPMERARFTPAHQTLRFVPVLRIYGGGYGCVHQQAVADAALVLLHVPLSLRIGYVCVCVCVCV